MTNKIIVGVHGIGDQFKYETIQAIAYQFCRHYKISAAIPLGCFHRSQNDGIFTLSLQDAEKLHFTEAYWAEIARKPEKDGYILEETKRWARTIVERFREQVTRHKNQNTDKTFTLRHDVVTLEDKNKKDYDVTINYRMIKSVLYEAIDTIDVIEKLLFILGKVGIFHFNLNSILTNFLGDVQVVAEFENYRGDNIELFIDTISRAYLNDDKADIYVVAHSEGTVVSFLGLLEAIQRGEDKCPWIKNVKGFMTIGSPIDKHLTLWPNLWKKYESTEDKILNFRPNGQIQWRNYYDRGDPVGYELDSARDWLDSNCNAFDFKEIHDYGFSRYYLPGKAHIDYWKDNEVFDNFLDEVVDAVVDAPGAASKKPEDGMIAKKATGEAVPKTLQDKKLAMLACNILPYIAITALLMCAVYFLYKPVYDSSYHNGEKEMLLFIRNIAGISAILAGVTVVSRIPRLTHKTSWLIVSILLFVAFSTISYFLLSDNGASISSSFGIPYIAVAAIIAVVTAWIGRVYSSSTSKPLVFLGGMAVLWSAVQIADSSRWPIFVGGAIFIYGWWLAILLFDLVFIWHWYIRNSKALERLREVRQMNLRMMSSNKG